MTDSARRHVGWLARVTTVSALAAAGLGTGAWAIPASWPWIAAAALALSSAATGSLATVSAARRGWRWAGSAQAMAILLGAGGGLAGAWLGWQEAVSSGEVPSLPAALGALVATFALLVVERHAGTTNVAELPEAPGLSLVLRVPVAVLLLLTLSAAAGAAGLSWAGWLIGAAALLVGVVSTELLLRAAAAVFEPAGTIRWRGRSLLASLLLTRPSASAARAGIERQFGIDLGRSFAFAFLRRAAVPALALFAFAGWLATGITALPIDQRGVYERAGAPQAVFGPGLHAHWPWPVGHVRRLELGVVHETPITLGDAPSVASARGASPTTVTAEGEPPASVDRLWEQSHPAEATYLVASAARGEQGFQVVDVDLRLVWRIGMSDASGLLAAYATDDPQRLIRAAAGRILVRVLASQTLAGLLGVERDTVAEGFRSALQADLTALDTGIEVVAVAVEAIHPPATAAPAYQNVQAAGIRSRIAVAEQSGQAAGTVAAARQTAQLTADTARIDASDAVTQARIEGARFGADRAGYAAGGAAFLLERRFDRLAQGLGRAKLVVMDHRLTGQDVPTLDLRSAPPVGLQQP